MTVPYYFYKQQMLKPEVYQAQLMQKFVQGKFVERGEVISPYLKAQVISFDATGGLLENPNAAGDCESRKPEDKAYYKIKARPGPANPPRSLRAKIITEHRDANTMDDDLRVYWPLFPPSGPDPVMLDFVYVFFDNNDRKHGLWVARVPGPNGEKINFAAGDAAMKNGVQGEQRLANAHGDSTQPASDYTSEDAIRGSRSDEGSLSGHEFQSA